MILRISVTFGEHKGSSQGYVDEILRRGYNGQERKSNREGGEY